MQEFGRNDTRIRADEHDLKRVDCCAQAANTGPTQLWDDMADIIRLIPKAELERARLIREARAIYDSIFPPNDVAGEQGDARASQETQPGVKS